VAASHHAQHNPNAALKDVLTVEDVLNSPMIADPLHRADCCVVTDSGGALVVVHPDIAKTLKKPVITMMGAGETTKGQMGGKVDLTYSGLAWAAPLAFKEAKLTPEQIRYASIYDSFTITVLIQLEDLGFCKRERAVNLLRVANLFLVKESWHSILMVAAYVITTQQIVAA
jgi:acetyl-CoA C-acetyltransferase